MAKLSFFLALVCAVCTASALRPLPSLWNGREYPVQRSGLIGAREGATLREMLRDGASNMPSKLPDDGPWGLAPQTGPKGHCVVRKGEATIPTPTMPYVFWSNELEDGAKIQLRSAYFKWLGPREGSWANGIVAENSTAPTVDEHFVVHRGDDSVLLQLSNGGFLGATSDGKPTLAATINDRTLLKLSRGGDSQIQLSNYQGSYLSASSDGFLSWSAVPGEAESFQVRQVANIPAIRAVNLGGWLTIEGWIKSRLFADTPLLRDGTELALQALNRGCFLKARFGGGGNVTCDDVSYPGNWEFFKLLREGEGFQLRTLNGYFLQTQDGPSASTLSAASWDAPNAEGRSTFNLVVLGTGWDNMLMQIQAPDGKYLEVSDDGSLAFSADAFDSSWSGGQVLNVRMYRVFESDSQLGSALGPEKSRQVMDEHRDTFVTKEDFAKVKAENLNTVRIPVGYWIAKGEERVGQNIPGGLAYLDKAFEWANEYGLRVMLDLHGVPGSQNGFQESGTRDAIPEFAWHVGNMEEALDAVEFLAERYANDPAFFAFELLNEPVANFVHKSFLTMYYEEGYKRVRKHSSCAYVLLGQRLNIDDLEVESFLAGPDFTNVVYDLHRYAAWLPPTTPQGVIEEWKELAAPLQTLTERGHLLFVGEWSLGFPAVDGLTNQSYVDFGVAELEFYAKYAKAGWAFWTWKLETDMPAWNFMESRRRGWLPYEEVDAKVVAESLTQFL